MIRNLNRLCSAIVLLGCAQSAAAQNGAPWFPMPMLHPGCAPYHAALADLDGDGLLDLASVGEEYELGWAFTLTVSHGRPDGSLGPPTPIALDLHGALDIDAVDIDHDGALDLLVVGFLPQGDACVEVLLALGGGSFAPVVETALGCSPDDSTFGDVDDDGQIDVLIRSGARQSLLRGHGDGTFAPAISLDTRVPLDSPSLVDIDGDGDLDLGGIAQRGTQWFLQTQHGNGDGTFGVEVRTALPWPAYGAPRFRDFDGDGFAEAVITIAGAPYSPSMDVELFPGLAGGAFGQPTVLMSAPWPEAPGVADIDHDGRADCFAGHYPYGLTLGGIGWVRNLGGLAFGPQTEIASGGIVYETMAGDIEGDGDLDFVTINDSWAAEIGVVKALSPGVFDTGTPPVVTPDHPIDAAVGDIDGDGVPDLAAICDDSSEVSLWRGLGDGRFARMPSLRGAAPMWQLLLEDFNGDGRADVVVSEGIVFGPPGEVRVWRSTPLGFARSDAYPIAGGAGLLASADFDGDGRKDLAVVGRTPPTVPVNIFHARANGTFEFIDAFDIGGQWDWGGTRLLAGDFDGDGVQDLADIPGEDCVVVSYGLGGGHFAPPVCTTTFEHIQLHAAGDLDLDGRDDLVFAELDLHKGTLYALYGRSDRTLDYSGAYFADLYGCQGAVIADINGNGRPDVVALGQTALDIITGDGQRGFDAVRGFSVGSEGRRPSVADLDLDGKLDVVVPLYDANRIAVLLHR